MHINICVMLLVILCAVYALGVPAPETISGETARSSDVNIGPSALAFFKKIGNQVERNEIVTKGVCGWASSASACSSACYILGWGWYTYWYATGECCCS